MKKLYTTLVAVLAIIQFSYAQWSTTPGNAYLYNTGNPTFAIIGSSSGVKTTYGFLGTSQDTSGYFDLHVLKSVNPTVFGNLVLNLNGGQVGIGSSNLATVKLNNSTNYTFAAGEARLIINNTSPNAYSDALVLKRSNSSPVTAAQGILFVDANSMQAAIRAKRIDLSTNYQSDLQFYTGDGISTFQDEANVRMTITHAGFVGIGTTTPREALSVNGNIRSQQVKVETANWPDYVFKKDYTLPSLSEVKTYIDLNQHLPEMPSKAEVAKDGINLGEMVKLQTKKIEELTLYLIDKDTKLQSQQKQIEDQNKQLTNQQTKSNQQDVRIDALEKALAKLTASK